MLEYDEALAIIANMKVAAGQESIAIADAYNRVLAEPCAMQCDQPPFDRATMDGFAIHPIPDCSAYHIVGAIHAGEVGDPPAAGAAVRIMTGAPVPKGCTVVPIECCAVDGDTVTIADAAHRAAGRNIAWQGEDAQRGSEVLARGTRLSPTCLAAAAMTGLQSLSVYQAFAAHIITTGDEVGGTGAAAIADSNGPLLSALCAELGLAAQRQHAADKQQQMVDMINALAPEVKLVITTGGVSMGDKDFVPAAAQAAGFKPIFHKVKIQPGKPVF